jgi:hypothetical protein
MARDVSFAVAVLLIAFALPAFARGQTTHPGARAYVPGQTMQEHRNVAVSPGASRFPPGTLMQRHAPYHPGAFHEPGPRTTLDGEDF